jgi:hypothetical protein
MLSALEMTKRNGGQVIAVNPLPEAGLIRFKNPQKVRGILGRGTVIADQFLHIKPGGDLALFQAINALLLEAERAAPGTVLDHEFIDAYTTGFAGFAEHAKQVSWPDVLSATGLSRADIEQVVDRVLKTRKIIVLGDGGDPAQVRCGDDPRNRQLLDVARRTGPAGSGRLSGPRPQQRPRRPDDGDLGADAAVVPRRAGA